MDILDEEILELWRLLNKNNVQYILVGGFASNLHGLQQTTSDMDLWIKDTLENRKNIRHALNELGIGDFEGIETIEFLAGKSKVALESGFELDLMTSLKGFEQRTFDNSYQIAPTAYIYDIPVKFLHLIQLIETKKASAQEKDLPDIIELEKIKNSKED